MAAALPSQVAFDVGGQRFTVSADTLLKHRPHPDASTYLTSLAGPLWRGSDTDSSANLTVSSTQPVFIDRCPVLFAAVLTFLRYDRLDVPRDVGPTAVFDELDFYGYNIPRCSATMGWHRWRHQRAAFRDMLRDLDSGLRERLVGVVHHAFERDAGVTLFPSVGTMEQQLSEFGLPGLKLKLAAMLNPPAVRRDRASSTGTSGRPPQPLSSDASSRGSSVNATPVMSSIFTGGAASPPAGPAAPLPPVTTSELGGGGGGHGDDGPLMHHNNDGNNNIIDDELFAAVRRPDVERLLHFLAHDSLFESRIAVKSLAMSVNMVPRVGLLTSSPYQQQQQGAAGISSTGSASVSSLGGHPSSPPPGLLINNIDYQLALVEVGCSHWQPGVTSPSSSSAATPAVTPGRPPGALTTTVVGIQITPLCARDDAPQQSSA